MNRILLLVLPFLLLPTALKAVADPNANRIGIYFDVTADSNCLTIGTGLPFMAFVLITNPSADAIHGVEFGYEIVVPPGHEDLIFRLANNLPAGAVDQGNSTNPFIGDYRYSLDAPLPPSVVAIALSWQFMILVPMSVDLYLKPASPESIPDGLPSYDNGTCHQRLDLSMGPSTFPAASVNGDCPHIYGRCCYEAPSHSPLVPVGDQDIEIALPFHRSYTGWDCGGGGPATLFYRYHFPGATAQYDSIPMVGDDPGEEYFWYFRAAIPGHLFANSVEYFVLAEDPYLAVLVTFPPYFCGGVGEGVIVEIDHVSDVPNDDSAGIFNLTCKPNPFNPQTKISFYADKPEHIRLAVYDIRGRLVAELTDQQYQAGEHSVEWRGRDSAGHSVPSGEYFFRVEIGGQVETRKAMLLR